MSADLPTVWDLSPLLVSDTDPKLPELLDEIAQSAQRFVANWKERRDYLFEPNVLAQALDEYERLQRQFGTSGTPGYYFMLRAAQDQDNASVKAQSGKLTEFATRLGNELQFFELNLATVAPDLQKEFLSSDTLLAYRHWLERIFAQAKHRLSEPEERLLNLKYPSSKGHWKELTSSLHSAEERELELADDSRHLLSFERISKLMLDRNKRVRDAAALSFNEILSRHLKVSEAEINALLGDKKVEDELRGFERPESSRHQSDDIPTETVDAMTAAVSARFDLPRRYYQLKARLFHVDRLSYHERNVEFGSLEKNYAYTDALALVRRALAKLDPQFADILDKLAAEGQIDVYPKPNKRGGAFCAYNLLSQPTYVMLNHTDRLGDVLTLAHELGHAINDELMRQGQNALNFGTSLATAEVASTFMEDFVVQELLEDADADVRLSLSMLRLDRDVSTIFRQVAIYRFEQDLHRVFRKRGFVSKEAIGKLFSARMGEYMGDGVSLDLGSENWWTYIGHIRNYFYVYSYASGELISKSLQAMVRNDPKNIALVKRFLAAGTSKSPKETFEELGIDMADPSFWIKGLTEVERRLKETESLAGILNV